MLQEERLLRIESLLATVVRVSTERIAQELDISRETARRDILALEAR
ncbi:DeoR family transcriptional regulator, partial [Paracidovorax cattleyae]